MGPPAYARCVLSIPADRYPAAVAVLLDLVPEGWQEEEDRDERETGVEPGTAGRRLTFWMADERSCLRSAGGMAALRALGELRCESQPDDWAEAWRRFHEPVRVAGLTIRAPWHVPAGGPEVVIDVGMAFGTGGHATTRGCLAALARLERGSLLDVGTGSGVLALAALRLGFAPVHACDDDPLAVAAARANAERNGLDLAPFLADCRDRVVGLPAADVVVANLTLEPIVALGERLSRPPAGGEGRPRDVVLGGLLTGEEAAGEAAFRGFARRRLDREGDWVTLTLGHEGR